MTNSKTQLDRLIEVRDNEDMELTEWEENFIRSCVVQLDRKGIENGLSDKQLAIVEKLEGYIINGRPNKR